MKKHIRFHPSEKYFLSQSRLGHFCALPYQVVKKIFNVSDSSHFLLNNALRLRVRLTIIEKDDDLQLHEKRQDLATFHSIIIIIIVLCSEVSLDHSTKSTSNASYRFSRKVATR